MTLRFFVINVYWAFICLLLGVIGVIGLFLLLNTATVVLMVDNVENPGDSIGGGGTSLFDRFLQWINKQLGRTAENTAPRISAPVVSESNIPSISDVLGTSGLASKQHCQHCAFIAFQEYCVPRPQYQLEYEAVVEPLRVEIRAQMMANIEAMSKLQEQANSLLNDANQNARRFAIYNKIEDLELLQQQCDYKLLNLQGTMNPQLVRDIYAGFPNSAYAQTPPFFPPDLFLQNPPNPANLPNPQNP